MAITNVVTIGCVGAKKKISDIYIAHVARELDQVVKERFDGNQTRAAKAFGMSQPHLSHLIAGKGRGPGLHVLMLLRMYTNRSIDSLLGLPPLPDEELTERLRAALDTEIARIRRDAKQDKAAAIAAAVDERIKVRRLKA